TKPSSAPVTTPSILTLSSCGILSIPYKGFITNGNSPGTNPVVLITASNGCRHSPSATPLLSWRSPDKIASPASWHTCGLSKVGRNGLKPNFGTPPIPEIIYFRGKEGFCIEDGSGSLDGAFYYCQVFQCFRR
ncbi:unnamed protein product, partial [Tuber aestivum]